MSSELGRANRHSRPRLRHPAEVPFFIFMVVLNVAIVAAILDVAAALPFLPDALKDSGWATAIRAAVIGLLLLVPALIVVRETQRASIRGTAVLAQLPRSHPFTVRRLERLYGMGLFHADVRDAELRV